MRAHTNNFKQKIKEFGRQLDSKITYNLDGETIVLGSEELNSITPNFKSSILKSAMRGLDIDSNINIPKGTIINYKFGVWVGNKFDYVDFGDYIVYSVEEQKDTRSYNIVAYDFMLYSMTEYKGLENVEFPMSIREYLTALCNSLSLEFADENNTFTNYEKIIESDLYKELGYTYRDIFDELSQVTASTICVNKDNKVEVRYIKETNDIIDEEYFNSINVEFGEKFGPVNSIVLKRAGESDGIAKINQESIDANGLCEISISENQIMNFNDRDNYAEDILERLDGLEFYLNDYSSTGICYYDICDRYTARIFDKDYSCVMFNDEINVTQGLNENVYTDKMEESKTDYTKTDETDRRINQTYIIVDKQNQVITSRINTIQNGVDAVQSGVNSNTDNIKTMQEQITDVQQTASQLGISITNINTNGVNKVITETGFVFDKEGLKITKSGEDFNVLINNVGLYAKRNNEVVLKAEANGVEAENITVRTYFIKGGLTREEAIYDDFFHENCIAEFWVGD